MRNEAVNGGMCGLARRLAPGLLAIFLLTSAARAQMLPFIPDPVTTPEFAGYADMLDLSSGQRLAALEVHDAYRREFRELEDGPVKVFIRDLTGLARVFTQMGFRIPERSAFENLIEQFDDIIRKAKAIDRRLLDQIVPILTEAQLADLPSVRIDRELDVYAHLMDGSGEMNPGASVVLSSLVRELDLGDAEIAAVEELLRQYERSAVRRMRKLYDILKEAAELALDTLDRTGLREMTMFEMMQLAEDEEFEGNMRVTFNEGSKPLQAELFAASQQNLRLLRQLSSLLTPDNREALRDRYFRVAYGRVYGRRSPWRFAFERALALESLDAERRGQVEIQNDDFRRREDQLIDRIVQHVEDWREYRTIAQLDEEDTEEFDERVAAFEEDRASIAASALAALAAILTPKEFAAVEPGADKDDDTSGDDAQMAGGGGPGGGPEPRGRDGAFGVEVPGMPGPLPVERREQLARLARLDEGGQAVWRTLHDDYRAEYAAALEGMKEEDAAEPEDDEESAKATTEDRVAPRLAALAALDASLFDAMKLAVDGVDAVVDIGRRLRARERAMAAARTTVFVFGREEAYVDAVGVVVAMEQSAEIVAATGPMIEAYGENVGPAVDERLVVMREAMRQMRIASRLEEHGRAGDRMAEQFADQATKLRGDVRKVDKRIRDANRRFIEKMEATLGRDLGWTVRVAYQREAYPEVYVDELGLDDALAAVWQLDDLTEGQATQVEGVVGSYRSRFSALCERMVRLRRQRDFDFNAMQMPSQKVIEGEIEAERLRFDRREAGSRAILELRLILSDAQIARCRLRELPEGGARAFE